MTDPLLLKVDTPTSSLPVAETSRLRPLGAAYLARLFCRVLGSSRPRHSAGQILDSPVRLAFIVLSDLLRPRFVHAVKSARIRSIAHPVRYPPSGPRVRCVIEKLTLTRYDNLLKRCIGQ